MGFNVLIPFTFLPVYAREALALPYAVSTRFVAAIALCGVVGQLTLGPLSDKIGRIRVLVICGLIMGSACLGMAFSHEQWMLYAFTGFYGWGYGAVWPVYAAAARDFFSADQTGGIVGLWTVFLGIASVVSPLVCGWTIDLTGSYTYISVTLLAVILSPRVDGRSVLLLALVVLLILLAVLLILLNLQPLKMEITYASRCSKKSQKMLKPKE